MEPPVAWTPEHAKDAYRVLEHPADLWLEVWGADLPALCEHGLLALYDNLVELGVARPTEVRILDIDQPTPADALRRLLAEALYLFDSEGFVGAAARVVTVAPAGDPSVKVEALVWGETMDPAQGVFLTEIKAVTYHHLTAGPEAGGAWRATVLLDV